MDEPVDEPVAPVEPAVEPIEPAVEPVQDAAPEPSILEEAGIELEKLASEVEDVIEVAVQDVAKVFHVVEQRAFGRPSADHPVIVTNIVGGQ